MSSTMTTALIAEDETLLAEHLRAELARLWPDLQVTGIAPHGAAAVEMALAQRPDIAFLDIRMPGLSGLEAAEAIAEEWPEGSAPPLLVFVTAYDQYALQAFERAAVDYVLKPVQTERLAQTVARLRDALRQRDSMAAGAETALAQLRALLGAQGLGLPAQAPARLTVIQAGQGSTVHLVPVNEVIYFEAADKYVRVITAEGEHLIRTSLRELLPQLDPERFWQVHRGTVVRCDAIATALRDEAGKVTLTLRGHAERLTVSRLYAHRFKPM
jgi:DNA-binding LytR/AlgR family response regulator